MRTANSPRIPNRLARTAPCHRESPRVPTLLTVVVLAAHSALLGCAPAPAREDTARGSSPDVTLLDAGSPLLAKLHVDAVQRKEYRPRLVAPATIDADPSHLAKVAPPLTGQVRQLLVRQGEMVRKGQPLFVLDAPDLVTAQADYLRARAVKTQAEHALRRQQDLFDHLVAAKHELEEAQTDFDIAGEDLVRARKRLEMLGINVSATHDADTAPLTVTSPLAGQVLSVGTAPGEFRNDSTTPLLSIADLSHVWVSASIPERDIARVQVGQSARVQVAAFPESHYAGTVQTIENLLDPDTRSMKVRIQLDNSDLRLKPGMFATVTILGSAEPAIMVPTSALLTGDKPVVWVERAPRTFTRRTIELGAQTADQAVVLSGLEPGERVVTQNGALLP